jgi:lysozyme family protein
VGKVSLTPDLRHEYVYLFKTCEIRLNRISEVDLIVSKILAHADRYRALEQLVKVPWYVIACIHVLEASMRFDRHLANGDPLTARTIQVPAGRPKTGTPPFSWEESAIDILTYKGLNKWDDWSLSSILYILERYNGWGYRNLQPEVLSPYLWSCSFHYVSGKYVKDHQWSKTAVSKQIGCAVILRRLAEKGHIVLEPTILDLVVDYSPKKATKEAMELQRELNKLPGIFLLVDGKAGKKTSDAFRSISGKYLPGDPRQVA